MKTKRVPLEMTEEMVRAAGPTLQKVDDCIQIAAVHGCPLVYDENGKAPLINAWDALLDASPEVELPSDDEIEAWLLEQGMGPLGGDFARTVALIKRALRHFD